MQKSAPNFTFEAKIIPFVTKMPSNLNLNRSNYWAIPDILEVPETLAINEAVKGWQRMRLKSGSIEGFGQYSQFSSLKEFNTHIEMWLVAYKDTFSKGELVGLKRLVRFAAKIPGVCNAKIGTILKAIHEEYHDNGISRSTFKRMVLKAKDLDILTVHETERKNGSQSSNLYAFQPFPASEPPKQEKMNQPKETINLSKTNLSALAMQGSNPTKGKIIEMKLTSKTYGDVLEIMTMKGNAGTTITIEVFMVPEGYKSFVRNNLVHHFDLEGYGVHKDKQKSVDLAIKELHKQIEICETSDYSSGDTPEFT